MKQNRYSSRLILVACLILLCGCGKSDSRKFMDSVYDLVEGEVMTKVMVFESPLLGKTPKSEKYFFITNTGKEVYRAINKGKVVEMIVNSRED